MRHGYRVYSFFCFVAIRKSVVAVVVPGFAVIPVVAVPGIAPATAVVVSAAADVFDVFCSNICCMHSCNCQC